MATVYLGIGSNLGDRAANMARALQLLAEHDEIDVLRVSEFMESEPEGGLPQPKFLNGAIQIKTDLMPLELLSQLKMIERRLGRVTPPPVSSSKGGPIASRSRETGGGVKAGPNAARPMDLDILFYEDVVIVEGKRLKIPHPRLAARGFVLKPLFEIAPDFIHPRLEKSVRELYENYIHENHSAPAGA